MRNLPQRDAPSGRECGSPIASHIPALTYLLLNTLTLPFQPLFLMLFQCPTHAYILWERNPILEILSWSKRTPARNVAILKGLHTNKKLVTLCPTPESSRCWDCLLQLPFGQRVMKAFLLLLSTPMMVSSYSLSCSHRPVNKHQSLDTQPWTLCTTMSDSFFILFISSVHPEDAALAADVDCNFQHVELINFQFGQNKRLCCIFFYSSPFYLFTAEEMMELGIEESLFHKNGQSQQWIGCKQKFGIADYRVRTQKLNPIGPMSIWSKFIEHAQESC